MNSPADRINRGFAAIEQARDAMRYYEHENWHCVNVKINDFPNHSAALAKVEKAQGKGARQLLEFYFISVYGSVAEGIDKLFWDSVVPLWWDDLEMDAPEGLARFGWARDKRILQLGRSGGWACFQPSTGLEYAEQHLSETRAMYNRGLLSDGDLNERLMEPVRVLGKIEEVKLYIERAYKDADLFGNLVEELCYIAEDVAPEWGASELERLNDLAVKLKKML